MHCTVQPTFISKVETYYCIILQAHGKAALHLAAENGHDHVVDMLLLNKAYVNAKSKSGIAPLHLAAQNGFNSLVKLLIETHKASIDALSLVVYLLYMA